MVRLFELVDVLPCAPSCNWQILLCYWSAGRILCTCRVVLRRVVLAIGVYNILRNDLTLRCCFSVWFCKWFSFASLKGSVSFLLRIEVETAFMFWTIKVGFSFDFSKEQNRIFQRVKPGSCSGKTLNPVKGPNRKKQTTTPYSYVFCDGTNWNCALCHLKRCFDCKLLTFWCRSQKWIARGTDCFRGTSLPPYDRRVIRCARTMRFHMHSNTVMHVSYLPSVLSNESALP